MTDRLRSFLLPRWRSLCVQLVLLLLLIGLWKIIKEMDSPWEGRYGKLLRAHKDLKFDDLVHVQLWWAAYVDRFIVGGLLLLSPLWLRWARRDAPPTTPALTPSNWKWLVFCLLLAFGVRAARMDRDIERDEQDTVRRDILGFYVDNPDGTEDYRPPPWDETLWEDAQANNPFLFSVTARLALRTWQGVTSAPAGNLNRIVLRLPALIPGMLSLVGIWWWLRRMGLPRGADIALFLGALHPMHVDYSAQARGYAFVMMFTALALGCAWNGLTRGRWRDWIGLAACLLGSLYSNPGSIYFCGVLGLCVGVFLMKESLMRKDAAARSSLTRFIVCCTVAGVIFIPLVLPALPQAMGYLKTFLSALDGPWPLQTLSKYLSGVMIPAPTEGHEDTGLTTWDYFVRDYLKDEHLLLVIVFLIVPALILMGAVKLVKSSPKAWPLVLGGIGAPIVAFMYHRLPTTPFLYYWYLIYALPVVIVMVAVGLEACGDFIQRHRPFPGAALVPTALFFVLLAIVNGGGGPGRHGWFPPSQTRDLDFERGKFHWITDAAGRTRRDFVEKPQ